MAWTTPKNWNVGELLIASDFNTHIRDNLDYLYDQASFLMLGSRTTLSGAAATMGVTGIDTNWEILMFRAAVRGTNGSTTDQFRWRFGGASLDTTAGNYASYAHLVNTTTPTHTVSENLGATAGIGGSGAYMPGGNATAGYFALHELIIFGGAVAANIKIALARGYTQNNLTTGNLGVNTYGGQWINATNTLQQVSLIAVSGSNLATGCWISVFGGNC